MPKCDAMKFLRIAAVPVISIVIGVPAFVSAQAPAKPSTAPAAPPVKLQSYTLPDKSASAGVPAGWKVKGGGAGMIVMSGPEGETITLGQIVLAHDGAFQVGQKGPDGAAIVMPNSATLSNKLLMIFQQSAAANGESAPQIKFISGGLLQVPAAMGQCGVFAVSNGTTQVDAMGILCSLPEDAGQFFKNILIIGAVPEAFASKDAPTVFAVLKSYTIAPGWTQKIFAPFMSPAAAAPNIPEGVDPEFWRQPAYDPGYDCTIAGLVGPSSYHQAAECGYLGPDF
jgi:F0F1-type ATP synthase membrane subunit c/vacuolar-type H+-ATPase subunit K